MIALFRKRITHNQGFTLVELIVVLAIIAILTGIGVPRFYGYTAIAKDRVDLANLKTLNKATMAYRYEHPENAYFEEGVAADDQARMNELVSAGYLEQPLHPHSDDGRFVWQANQWQYGDHAVVAAAGSLISRVFRDSQAGSLEEYRRTNPNNWHADGDGFRYQPGAAGLLFIPNPLEEYTVATKATLGSGAYGGYGILFESSLTEDNADTGYIVQFDRGYGRGSVVIRPRNNGVEGHAASQFVFDYKNSKGIIPDKTTDEGAAWWTNTHEVTLKVEKVPNGSSSQKQLTVYIGGEKLFDNYTFESQVNNPADNFTGFRSWSTPTTYHEMTIAPQ